VSAGTRIHGCHEGELRRVPGSVAGTNQGHVAILERLTQGFEYLPWKLRKLVQEEDAAMSEADLARPGGHTSPHEACGRRCVVG